ncbi:MAG TPA: DUF2608 domain-containing protein [Chlamydiales bacterium]|nr:DUF2608 domain-containing protein [Chlamydiales bacterium]
MAKYLILFIIFSLHAEIIETNQMEDILPHIDETTWVLFDIDNTLLESSIQAGRAEWFHHEIRKLVAQGLDKETAEELFYPDWDRFMNHCPIRTPEPEIASLVKKVQKRCAASFALTSRHPPLSNLTLRQLKQLDIDFSRHAPASVLLKTPHPTHWEEGILFASHHNPKGTLFRQFLEKSKKQPPKIVFIDDTKHHLLDMEMELEKLGIEFIGVHYTKTFERPFEAEVAEREFQEILDRL